MTENRTAHYTDTFTQVYVLTVCGGWRQHWWWRWAGLNLWWSLSRFSYWSPPRDLPSPSQVYRAYRGLAPAWPWWGYGSLGCLRTKIGNIKLRYLWGYYNDINVMKGILVCGLFIISPNSHSIVLSNISPFPIYHFIHHMFSMHLSANVKNEICCFWSILWCSLVHWIWKKREKKNLSAVLLSLIWLYIDPYSVSHAGITDSTLW